MTADGEPCPFCEIVRRGDADAREVFRDENVVAFFPTDPATLGHTLIIPTEHIPDIWSLDEESAEYLSVASLKVARAVREALQPDGLNIIQSNGEVATQSVFHLHVHVVPRWIGDGMGDFWPPQTNFTEAQKDATKARVQRSLAEGRSRWR